MKWPTTRADILKPGFSTPLDAPMVPPFPFTFRNAEILTLTYRTDPAAIRALLPEPLASTGDRVMIHVYKMNDTDWLGPYHEVNVMVGATLPGKATGAYSPWLFLSSDIGVAHGRELHGQPKKLGNPKLEFRGDLIVGSLERNGIDVLTGTMPYKQTKAEIADLSAIFPFATNLNLKAIDHIDGTPAIRQLTSRQLAEVQVTECWRGPCTVELRPNAQAPLHRLPVVEMLDGFYWSATFTLVPGVVLHDYLTEV
ncbi:acetoacetate decarboxylase [Tabrizicola sp. BL-A-41-H6]|uniref:acetoacetate decarboxylase n=1 Tax=Tabrizicola sp. BL-A-41-H6 TaxID=3421107 RepID=UPI003D67C54D